MMLGWKVVLYDTKLLTVLLLIGHNIYSHFTWTSRRSKNRLSYEAETPSFIHKIKEYPQKTQMQYFQGHFIPLSHCGM